MSCCLLIRLDANGYCSYDLDQSHLPSTQAASLVEAILKRMQAKRRACSPLISFLQGRPRIWTSLSISDYCLVASSVEARRPHKNDEKVHFEDFSSPVVVYAFSRSLIRDCLLVVSHEIAENHSVHLKQLRLGSTLTTAWALVTRKLIC